jgi:phosphomannomutase
MSFLFDIDGTLTPSRLPIDPDFKLFFLEWLKGKNVYLVTGSDYEKSLEQVGPEILTNVKLCFNNAGNVRYQKGIEIYRSEWSPPKELIELLNTHLQESSYPIRAGNHIEYRIGMLNFSIVGRNCTQSQRMDYFHYDLQVEERQKICSEIMRAFPDLEANIGGQISIDIHQKGKNKSQVISLVESPITFIGDRTEEGGNDYPISSLLRNPPHRVISVRDWKDTYEFLKNGKKY